MPQFYQKKHQKIQTDKKKNRKNQPKKVKIE